MGVKLLIAVLADVVVAKEDIGAGKAHDVFLLGQRHVGEKTQNRGDLDGQANRADFLLGLLDDFHFTLK